MSITIQSGTYRRDYGGGHQYFLDDVKVIGVTSILNNGFPKPGLTRWAGNSVAEFAVDNWRRLSKLPLSQRMKEMAAAPYNDRDGAGRLGTKIHGIAERINNGEDVSIPKEVAGHVEQYQRFLIDWEVEPVHAELPVFSRKHHYGGTIDLLGRLRGDMSLVDVKSSRTSPFGDIAFQLAGYKYADFAFVDGQEIPIPEIQYCRVVWLQSDHYEVFPYTVTPRQFNQFLSIKDVAEAAEESKFYKGDPE
jgi:hypothetical protein